MTSYRVLLAALIGLLALLQYLLWFGDGGMVRVAELEERIEVQAAENEEMRQRNEQLRAEVGDLKEGLDAVEEIARSELGLIREDETFLLMVEE